MGHDHDIDIDRLGRDAAHWRKLRAAVQEVRRDAVREMPCGFCDARGYLLDIYTRQRCLCHTCNGRGLIVSE